MKFFLFCACAGSIIGGLTLIVGVHLATGAPQEAAVAAIAVAWAVVPYVFARSVQLWGQANLEAQRHKDLMLALSLLSVEQRPPEPPPGREVPPRQLRFGVPQ